MEAFEPSSKHGLSLPQFPADIDKVVAILDKTERMCSRLLVVNF
jgi:hypothetical protein